MKQPMRTTATFAGIAVLSWACATHRSVPPQGTASASSAVYGSAIVPVKKGSDTDGILRVTNNSREALQVFLASPGGDSFLREIQPQSSDFFRVPGRRQGDTISLRAKTSTGREYTSGQPITLGASSCAKNYGPPPAVPGCEWTVP